MDKQVWSRVLLVAAAIGAGATAFWFFAKASDDALMGLITYFSISSGVLVAALTLVGNSTSLLPRGEWKVLQEYQKTFGQKVTRLTVLSYVQILVVGALCFALFVGCEHVARRIAVSLAASAFVLSLGVPAAISGIYREYYQFVIDYGRQDSRRRVKVSGTLEVGRGKDEEV